MGSHGNTNSPSGLYLAAPPLDARRVMDSLRRIVRALRVSAAEAERKAGLTSAQLFVLQQLAEGPARSLAELAERTLTDPSSVSAVVARLSARGIVKQERSDQDARKSEISLSRRGKALLARTPLPAQARLVEALAGLPGLERRSLAHALAALADAMAAGDQAPAMFFEDEPAAARSPAGKRTRRPRD